MANSENNIERYWCRTYNGVLNNTGFLLNPQNKYSFTEQNIVDLNDISQNACILLCNTIGEVSYDFSIMHQRVRDKYNDTFCIYHDLSSY